MAKATEKQFHELHGLNMNGLKEIQVDMVQNQIQLYLKLKNYRNHSMRVMAETTSEDGTKTYSIGQRQVAKLHTEKKNGKGKGRKV